MKISYNVNQSVTSGLLLQRLKLIVYNAYGVNLVGVAEHYDDMEFVYRMDFSLTVESEEPVSSSILSRIETFLAGAIAIYNFR